MNGVARSRELLVDEIQIDETRLIGGALENNFRIDTWLASVFTFVVLVKENISVGNRHVGSNVSNV